MTKVLGDSWYAEALGADVLSAPSGSKSILRGLVFFMRSRQYERVLAAGDGRSVMMLSLCLTLAGQRKLVLVEFLPGIRTGVRAHLTRALWRFTLPRAAAQIQVMTAWEVEAYANIFGVAPERITHVPWPIQASPGRLPPPYLGERHGVVASGRNSCDWETFFAAAHGQAWDVTVICGTTDLKRVRALAQGAKVLCEVSYEDHFTAVSKAAVYAMPLQETNVSAGHTRLAIAIAASTPVVASNVRGMSGYLMGTAQPVTPGDPMALRRAIQRLIDDPHAAKCAAEEASTAVAGRTRDRYLARLRELIDGS